MCACINFLSLCIIITTHVQVCNICYKKFILDVLIAFSLNIVQITENCLFTTVIENGHLISDEETDYFCLITLIPVYLLHKFNTRTQSNLPCTTTRTQTDTLSLSAQSLQASSVLIKLYRSMLEFSLHHQFPFVYSFSKYNFLLKKT